MKLPAVLAELVGTDDELDHLEQALTHPSFANEQKRGPRIDYQRLEFLGDAVIQLCVSEALMRLYPEAREGELSLLRSRNVTSNRPCAAVVSNALRNIWALIEISVPETFGGV